MNNYITFWVDKDGSYKLPSIARRSRYNFDFKKTIERKIILSKQFIESFNFTWGKMFGFIKEGQIGYIYKSEIFISR